MYRGTTPNLVFKINSDIDLTDISKIYVTIKSKLGDKTREFTETDLDIDAENKKITLPLTQYDTLYFKGSSYFDEGKVVYVQLRIKDSEGSAYASNIMTLTINDILKDGEI